MEKVLVAGGLGFLGANVASKFKETGYKVDVCSRRTGVDIREYAQINNVLKELKPDIVVNCAAHVGGIAYNAKCPVAIYEDNLIIGFNLLKASVENKVLKFVNIMPNCTYPGIAQIYQEDMWWDGSMHPTVLTYGMPRKALWVQAWAYKMEHEFNSIHLVLPNLYGPRDHFDIVRSHALGALITKIVDAKLRNEQTVEIWGTGAPVREWMYVEDAAEGIVIATRKYNEIDILNLGSEKGCTIKELAEVIKEEVGWKGRFIFDTQRPDGALRKILDVAQMKSKLNWAPATGLRQGIRKTVIWYMDNFKRGIKRNEIQSPAIGAIYRERRIRKSKKSYRRKVDH